MFTGLVQGLGQITQITPQGGESLLTVRPGFAWDGPLVMGESIAVSGVCLTVNAIHGESFGAFVSHETLAVTTLGRLKTGRRVNLERALKLGDRLGGHLVSGHVDAVARLVSVTPAGLSQVLRFELKPGQLRYLVPKGSVAIEGVSLTVNGVDETGFTVNIIPHTLGQTTLKDKRAGDEVNIETDLIGKYLARLAEPHAKTGGLDKDFLAEHGFI